jgi:fructuronate reductase
VTPRLSSHAAVRSTAATPGYAPESHRHGIVHLGIGAFHRAHQAVYTDAALAAEGGDWRIVGVSLRGSAVADALNPQQGRYTLVERGQAGTTARVIGSIERVLAVRQNRLKLLPLLADPATRIVSMTVTEKAYALDRINGGMRGDDPVIAHDLSHPRQPDSVIGLLVESLRLRREANRLPFTVLCCDNLPNNGQLVRAAVLDFASRIDPDLQQWIGDTVAFPVTMVDRITPASTAQTLADAQELTGLHDLAAVEAEPFTQWIIEDKFPAGRPAWEAGGAVFVDDVQPWERMKLRMLNGTHSMLAYAGFLAGLQYVRDVMHDSSMAALVQRHLQAAGQTLTPLPDMDSARYADALVARFANPSIAHETWQIAMDGTEKIPQRLLQPAVAALENAQDARPFAFAVAAWMRYCLGHTDDGQAYALRDPQEHKIRALLAAIDDDDAGAVCDALQNGLDIYPAALLGNSCWQQWVIIALQRMMDKGMVKAIEHEVSCSA